MEHNIPDYITITAALEKLDTEVTPSEVHGTLTGILCAITSAKAELWQHNLWPHMSHDSGDLLAAEALEVFNQLHDTTRLQINDPNCEFQLLLPVDDDHIDNRVNALGDWCQAYLVGFSSYSLEGNEEDENAYAELVEYIRVGVLLINEELQPTKSSPQSESTLH